MNVGVIGAQQPAFRLGCLGTGRYVRQLCASASLSVLLVILGGLVFGAEQAGRPSPGREDVWFAANRQFVQAIELLEEANRSYDADREAAMLREAGRLLDSIINDYPETDLAVQLVTNQFIGDFDYFEFKMRLAALVCLEPLSTACFVHRISALLPPIDVPITVARWDWLSLAVARHRLLDQPEQARDIIGTFLSAVRRGLPADVAEPDLYVSRALALTGYADVALGVTRLIGDCSNRIHNLIDIARVLDWRGDGDGAAMLVDEARRYTDEHTCRNEIGLIIQGLALTGQVSDARALFARTLGEMTADGDSRREECCPEDFVVAAAEIADPDVAIGLLRRTDGTDFWVSGAVLRHLARRGEFALATQWVERIRDPAVRGGTYADLVEAFQRRGDDSRARQVVQRLSALIAASPEADPILLAQQARAELWLYGGDAWRPTFRRAVLTAEHGDGFTRRDIAGPLLAALVHIETGYPLLE